MSSGYSDALRARIKAAPAGLGATLGKLAVRKEYSVVEIAAYTGATRTTVYNWLTNGIVSPAYRKIVAQLIETLKRQK